ncbi:MAG: DUF1805 domain-containing protein [Candidatus Omnitrophica bacterium]|nr:DUF1805 domain-containing protein [Candidatus Omnitrophota bacterium]
MNAEHRTISVGNKTIEGFSIKLQSKSFVLLRGERGYIMCGYLNLEVAEKFNDAAVVVVGVSNIDDALKATVHSCTSAARSLGIRTGQPISEILPLLV